LSRSAPICDFGTAERHPSPRISLIALAPGSTTKLSRDTWWTWLKAVDGCNDSPAQ
jgi:hypothetical protein